jgi:hypothetical protein
MTKEIIGEKTLLDEEQLNEAMKNPAKFKELRPCEQLEALFFDLMKNGTFNKDNLIEWNEKVKNNGISYINNEYFKVVQIVRLLDGEPDTNMIETIINTKILEFCLPKLFTKLNKNITINLNLFGKNISKVKGDGLDKFVLLLTIFPKASSLDTLGLLNLDEKYYKYFVAIDKLEDFTIINDKDELKRFIYNNGKDVYDYMFRLSSNYIKAYEFPEYRYLSKKYLLEEIYKQKEPIFPEDLAIDRNDLMESGIADRNNVDELMNLLTEHVHNKPYKNNREDLLEAAERISRSKLQRIFRKIKWIK